MADENDGRIAFKLPEDEKQTFFDLCAANGQTPSLVLRLCVRDYNANGPTRPQLPQVAPAPRPRQGRRRHSRPEVKGA